MSQTIKRLLNNEDMRNGWNCEVQVSIITRNEATCNTMKEWMLKHPDEVVIENKKDYVRFINNKMKKNEVVVYLEDWSEGKYKSTFYQLVNVNKVDEINLKSYDNTLKFEDDDRDKYGVPIDDKKCWYWYNTI